MVDAALVGLGWWGQVLLAAAQGAGGGLRFVRGVTPDAEHAAAAADRFGLDVVAGLEEVLADPGVEAVVLATPHSQHVDQVLACAAAGRHVYCEKPLALTLRDGRRAVEACREAGVVLGLGTDKRFLPAVRELAALAAGGALGTLLHLEGQYSNPNSARPLSGAWRAAPGEAPAAGMSGPGLHALDGMVAIAGRVGEVDARVHETRPPYDSVAARLAFASGATGVLATVRAVPDYFRLGAFGTDGWAEVHGFGTLTTSLGNAGVVRRELDATLRTDAALAAFAAAIRGGEPFAVTATSMLETVAAFEAIVTSADERRSVEVPW